MWCACTAATLQAAITSTSATARISSTTTLLAVPRPSRSSVQPAVSPRMGNRAPCAHSVPASFGFTQRRLKSGRESGRARKLYSSSGPCASRAAALSVASGPSGTSLPISSPESGHAMRLSDCLPAGSDVYRCDVLDSKLRPMLARGLPSVCRIVCQPVSGQDEETHVHGRRPVRRGTRLPGSSGLFAFVQSRSHSACCLTGR